MQWTHRAWSFFSRHPPARGVAARSPEIPRASALLQAALAALFMILWVLFVRQSGLGAWLQRSLGASAIIAAIALQGAPALLVIALLLRWSGERWSAIGLGQTAPLTALGRGLLIAAVCYAVQPLVVNAYLAATGRTVADLASQKSNWLGTFADLPAAALFPIALFVGLYEEILFRGFLQSRLMIAVGAAHPPRRARAAAVVALSALLFGMGHGYQGPVGILQTTAIGLVLGTSVVLTDSLWPAIVAHVAIDTIGLATAKYLTQADHGLIGLLVR